MLVAKKIDNGLNNFNAYISSNFVHFQDIDYALINLKSWMKNNEKETPFLLFPSRIYHKIDPMGPTLIIGSWNYPFSTLFIALISAISAGNPCILKPSERAV